MKWLLVYHPPGQRPRSKGHTMCHTTNTAPNQELQPIGRVKRILIFQKNAGFEHRAPKTQLDSGLRYC